MQGLWLALPSGLIAAGLAFVANQFLLAALSRRGPQGGAKGTRPGALLVTAIPVVEEGAKDLAAVLLGASLPGTHVIFGLVELVHEVSTGKRRGLATGLIGLYGHATFGFSTLLILRTTGSWLFAAGVGVGLHSAWNALALRLGRRG